MNESSADNKKPVISDIAPPDKDKVAPPQGVPAQGDKPKVEEPQRQ